MSTQRALLGSTGLATLVAALLLTAAIVVPSRADRVVLDTSILESSRGGNQAGNLSSYTCDKNNGNFGCENEDDQCVSCTGGSYVTLGTGAGGGYGQGNQDGICGLLFTGTCDANLKCVTAANSVGVCAAYDVVFVQPITTQPQPPN